jgi:hypothetical protein
MPLQQQLTLFHLLVPQQQQAELSFYNLQCDVSLIEKIMSKLARRQSEENKMLLLIFSSMYEQYREGDGARWF